MDEKDPVPQVPAPLRIITTSLPYAINGAGYSLCIEAAGGREPYTWSIIAGVPPNPMTINPATGVLYGIPGDTPGDDTFTVQVLDSATPPATATRDFTITVYDQLQITFSPPLPVAVNGEAYGPVTIAASGGTGNITWSITAGSLPGGLSLDPGSGQLSGTPGDTAGAYAFTVTVQDDATPLQTDTLSFTMNLYDFLSIITVSLPNAGVGVAYSAQVETAGGSGDLTWSLSGAPASLSIDAATGVVSGTPVPGDETGSPYTFTVGLSDNVMGDGVSRDYSVLIRLVLNITTANLPDGCVGATYSETLTAGNGVSPLAWSEVGSNLATYGLTLNADGTITGTPTQAGTCNFTARVSDSGSPAQQVSEPLSIVIREPLQITTSTVADGVNGQSYGPEQLTATGGAMPYTWSEDGSNLSTYGLTLNSDGTITGTPTQAGTCNFTARVTDSGTPAQQVTDALSIVIREPLQITTTTLPEGVDGQSYGPEQLTATGGATPYTWSEDGSNLATYGLTLNPDGTITGTPTQAGTCNFTAKVTDSDTPAQETTKALSITVYDVLVITTTTLPEAVDGQVYGPEQLTATGGATPYTWSEVGTGLSTFGLTLNPDGTITGTPTQTGICNFTARAVDSTTPPTAATRDLTITLYDQLQITFSPPLPDAVEGVAYGPITISAVGGTGNYTWSITAGSLPNGLSLDPSSGEISGTPSDTVGSYASTVAVQDDAIPPQTDTLSLTLNLYDPLSMTTLSLPDGVDGQSYGPEQLAATGGVTPYTWSEVGSNLSTYGLTLNPDGTITGTSTQTGICNFTAKVTDSGIPAQSVQKAFAITIYGWPFALWGGTEFDCIAEVTVDTTGNIYCAGMTTSFGAGGYDGLLLKYDASGSLQWAKTWGGTGWDTIGEVAVDSGGNVYCAGDTNSFGAGSNDAFLLKYDSSGALQWAKTWGGTDTDGLYGVAVDSGGNIYCAGWTWSFGAGYYDALLLKYNSSGALQWTRTWGGTDDEWIYGLAVDSSGNIYCAGVTDSFGAGSRDTLLLKYDTSGVLQWARTWGGTSVDSSWGVAVDSGGNIYCAGYTMSFGAGDRDALLLKYDASGTLQWARTWGGGAGDMTYDFTVSSMGDIYTVGWTVNFGAGSYDALLLKYNDSGTFQWAKTWGGGAKEYTYGVLVDSSDNIYLGGSTESYTGAWQTITTGTETAPSGTESSPVGSEDSPTGTEGSPTGTEGSPVGSETGAGGLDALLLKNWQ